MPVKLAVAKESVSGERRVAIVPDVANRFTKLGAKILLQQGAADLSYFPDSSFKNISLVNSYAELCQQADVVLKVQAPSIAEANNLKEGSILVSFIYAHRHPELIKVLLARKITTLAMELVPRITRAQSMDALSSQASVAGYKSVLIAANLCSQFFPMLTTAAGTIRPAKVLIIGAGVAGLQAIATAKRLGAIVEAYDVRSATKEQVESLGAKFVQLAINAEGSGGYARELTEEEKNQQRELLAKHISQSHIVITTAAIPGRDSPKLIFRDMVERMQPGAVIVDLAAEGGGNCELTQAGKTINHQGVIIDGPINVPTMLPIHASEMYARNLLNLLQPMIKNGELAMDWNDEVIKGCLLTRDGAITHGPTQAALSAGAKS